jgi:hypothetical protein
VISTTTHKIYESAQAANLNNNPTTAANVPLWWLEVSATNRWMPFDKSMSAKCTLTGSIRYRLLMASTVDVLAVMGLSALAVSAVVYKYAGVARRNLLTYSYDQSNAVYVPSNLTVTGNAVQDPLFLNQAAALVETVTNTTHTLTFPSNTVTSGLNYTVSFSARRILIVAGRDVYVTLPNARFSSSPQATFNLLTGAVSFSSGVVSASIVADGDFWRCSITGACTTSGAATPIAHLVSGAATTYLGNGVSGIYMAKAQFELGALTAYQWVDDALSWGDVAFSQRKAVSSELVLNSKEAVFTGFSADNTDFIELMVSPLLSTGVASVTEIVPAKGYNVGTLTNSSVGIVDYSTVTRDTFGTPTIVKRNYANRADYTVVILRSWAASTRNFLADFRATPLLFFTTVDPENLGMTVYGVYSDFDIPVTGADRSFMSLSVLGLT